MYSLINNIKLIAILLLLLFGIQYSNGQKVTNDTLRVEAFKEGVFHEIWGSPFGEVYIYDYNLIRSLSIDAKKVVALYTSFITHLFNDETDNELAQALGNFPTLAAARESLLEDYGKTLSETQIYGIKLKYASFSLKKESNATLRANPYSLKIKKLDNKIYAEWCGSRSSRSIVDEFMIDRQLIIYVPEVLLEKPYDREYLISQYRDYWTLLNGKHIYPELTYLDAENIESIKVSERDRIVYIVQKNKEAAYFSLNDVDLSAFNVGIDSIKQIKSMSIIDNGKYSYNYSSIILMEKSSIDSITIRKNEEYEFYQLSIWLNSQNKNEERCLSYSYYDEDIKKIVYTQPEIMAEYPGGDSKILHYIWENMKAVIPDEENDLLQTKTLLHFIVDDDGIVRRLKVIKRIVKDEHSKTKYEYKTEEEYTSYDREFVRVVKTMQRWTPAVCNERNVPSLYSLPIRFNPSR